MSWSVGAVGEVAAVAAEIERQFTAMTYPCPEPEESAKQSIRAAIAAALSSPVSGAVKVSASGSQSCGSQSSQYGPDGKVITNCTVDTKMAVEPLWGFVK